MLISFVPGFVSGREGAPSGHGKNGWRPRSRPARGPRITIGVGKFRRRAPPGLVQRVARGKNSCAPPMSTTGACSVSASSTRSGIPAAVRAARSTISTGIFRGRQHASSFRDRGGVSLRRRGQCEARDAQFRVRGDGVFLQLTIGDQHHGHHRRPSSRFCRRGRPTPQTAAAKSAGRPTWCSRAAWPRHPAHCVPIRRAASAWWHQ